jgi:Ran GTPase-activating protein (RanGAP) involved in mRNA processing and transport
MMLSLEDIGIEDGMVKDVCSIVASLPKLEELCLQWNSITAFGFEELFNCLNQKQRKLKKLDIDGNEGAEDKDTVQKLAEICDVVGY